MRPFDFRAWHVPSQRLFFVYSFTKTRVYELLAPSTDPEFPYDVYTEAFPREDCVLMQFTGLTDVNGVRLYEGDVLYYCYEDPDDPEGSDESYYKVVYRQGSLGTLHIDSPNTDGQFYPFSAHNLEHENVFPEAIVGTVFEQDKLPPLTRFVYSIWPAPAIKPPPVNLGKKELCETHKALLAWQNALDALSSDPVRVNSPHAYQVHFTWLSALQGLPPREKNDLFIILRERAKANGIDWHAPGKNFLLSARKEVLAG